MHGSMNGIIPLLDGFCEGIRLLLDGFCPVKKSSVLVK
jgi:hypothetical protein